MKIGPMRHRVTVQVRGSGQDSHGQNQEIWTDVVTTWASIRPVSGREFFAASGERAEITHEILLRHGVSLTPQHRILHEGRVFDVQSVLNVAERDRFLDVKAIERGQ